MISKIDVDKSDCDYARRCWAAWVIAPGYLLAFASMPITMLLGITLEPYEILVSASDVIIIFFGIMFASMGVASLPELLPRQVVLPIARRVWDYQYKKEELARQRHLKHDS